MLVIVYLCIGGLVGVVDMDIDVSERVCALRPKSEAYSHRISALCAN